MSYDERKWAANEAKRRPRRWYAKWYALFGIAVSLTLATVATIAQAAPDPPWPHVFTLMFPMLTTALSPFARETWFTDRGLATLDEFEREALFRATTRAYLIGLLAVAALLAWLALATTQGWPMPQTGRAWISWCFAAIGIEFSLPITIAEFTVPIPPAGDPEDII